MKSKKFSLRARFKSFRFAFEGIAGLWRTEHNFRIHIFAAIFVIAAAIYLQVSALEWISLLLCIGFVLFAEIMNSALENLCDFVSPEKRPAIKLIKDMCAAAVLLSACISCAVGLIIFVPRIAALF